MNDKNQIKRASWKLPLLLICAVLIILLMLRLGVWQLSRADQKAIIVKQLERRSELPALSANDFVSGAEVSEYRFRKVALEGRYAVDKTIYVDNQVVNGQVGYQVFTPLLIRGHSQSILVARGFIGIGESREVLPTVFTDPSFVNVVGRLNTPPAEPPIWNDDYPIFDGLRWQFLPMADLEEQLHLDLFPLVVELAPSNVGGNTENGYLIQQWSAINDQGVAKHKGYAFQWFAMAVAFFIACLILLMRTTFRKT